MNQRLSKKELSDLRNDMKNSGYQMDKLLGIPNAINTLPGEGKSMLGIQLLQQHIEKGHPTYIEYIDVEAPLSSQHFKEKENKNE